ncbi:MAG TPA: tRNA (adenosine(37)-N6)-dimethylallyltransferase MiaA [Candidatus Binataceae bacterium]|nr:tRNA (adenosine(37)-N6)-dimethylallyltransferase MiaA [Candidatus Binataceae bacterium]
MSLQETESKPLVSSDESLRRIRVGFIVGPTGAGKSALALEVAGRIGAEIINADSRQFYRGMDIGTAKPTAAERERVRHHLIDIRDPAEPVDVAEFAEIARATIADIAGRGRAPLVVGGSGLYQRVLRGGIFNGPAASGEIRARLSALADERGTIALHDQLREIDSDAANRIGINDRYRIIRALEVFELTGEPISVHQRRHRFSAAPFDTLTVGIVPDRGELYAAINRRFHAMIAAGLVDEVKALISCQGGNESQPMRAIGYKQVAAHLRGEMSLDNAIELAKRDSRRLAKRQLTWFRAQPEIVWLDPARAVEQALELFRDLFSTERRARDAIQG